jgi:hypothetical protein
MTEYPRKGDRVKVTYEGVVTKADDMLHRFFEVDGISVPAKGGVVKVTKRTFKPGTALLVCNTPVFKTREGWVWVDGSKSSFDDDYFRTYGGMTVLYEPPA